MNKIFTASFALCLATVTVAPAQATPFDGVTIRGLAIGDNNYNVTFVDAPFSSIPSAERLTFTTSLTALNALNIIKVSSAYTSLVASASSYFVGIVVPRSNIFFDNRSNAVFSAIVQTGESRSQFADVNKVLAEQDYSSMGYTIATFSIVPEPASIAVMAFGLFGLGWARRRFVR